MGYGKTVRDELRVPTRELRHAIPLVYAGYKELHDAALAEGALDARTKELIALAIAVSKECDGCIAAHAHAAVQHGATPREAAEAIGVTFLMNGGPATVYGARAYAAFREFYDERAAGGAPAGQEQPAGHEHEIGRPNGHQHVGTGGQDLLPACALFAGRFPAVGEPGLADRLPGPGTLGVVELHVGCAMWTYAPWQGRYLPGSLSPRDRLSAYATWCNAVEGNTTFYATPALGTVRSWAEQTTPDFRFVLKLPRTITHERRMADVAEPLRAFLAAIEPLGPRAHALWVQLPPSFSPADLGALAGFLHRLPPGHRYCVEVRHRAFFQDPRSEQQLERALGEVGAEWVTFDTTVLFGSPPVTDAEREAWRNKPRVPRRSRALTAHPVVRYLGRDDAARTIAGWRPWLEAVAGWLREGRSPTVFIHTPDNVDALELARRFHDDVRARVPEVEPLPEPIPAGPPTLF